MSNSVSMFERYLDLLDVDHREPGISALKELVAAQLYLVPFENVSKLYNKKHLNLQNIPSLPQYLDGIQRHHFGGTCYTNNVYFNQLLNHLGYIADLCGADMNDPDVHLVNIIRLDDCEFLVDVGYGAPFDVPMPRDLADDYIIRRGQDQYILRPRDSLGCSQMELHRGGEHKHGYRVKPAPRRIEEFEHVIQDSFRSEATFMNTLLLARFFPGRSLVVHNYTVIDAVGTNADVKLLSGTDELVTFIVENFEIPGDIVLDVLQDLGELRGDAWDSG